MHEDIIIRLTNIDDMKNVFDLSNDSCVRINSINKEPILWENHKAWFCERINSSNPFYIVENKNKEFIAQVRFDLKEQLEISISITKNYRNKGLASRIIKEASKKTNIKEIVAIIQEDNIASIKAFIKAGYKECSSVITKNTKYKKMVFYNKD